MELLDIFDQDMNKIGVLERNQVHQLGHWHQTFHCWFVEPNGKDTYIYIQKRQKGKDTFPEKFDITVAGHLTANETPENASREIHEEIGIKVNFHQLHNLGIVADEIITSQFVDREFCHVYMYQCELTFEEFTLQHEEVAGIYKAKLGDLIDLFLQKQNKINVVGIEVDQSQHTTHVAVSLTEAEFVPHVTEYYLDVFNKIKNVINAQAR